VNELMDGASETDSGMANCEICTRDS